MGQPPGPGDYDAPLWGGPPSGGPPSREQNVRPMDPLVGTTVLGSYYIMQRLGSGGIGTVYKGRHLETDRIVAIKTLKGYLLTDPVVVKRFEREAKGLSKLQHQNIVAALDCLMSPQGQPFFIMEYLEGITLARYIKEEGALDPEDGRPIFLQLCDALSHVHRHGLLHRDLKPENVILMPQNDGSVLAKIVDFGLAQIKDNIQRVTVDGTVVGSPVYMSPEQCMGREPDHRSDLYSLGVIMYETLVGRPPFVGNPMDIMKAHVSEQPPTFAAVRPFQEVPKEIEKVVFKALEKHPDDRYESAKEFRHAIEFWIAPQGGSHSSHSSSNSHSSRHQQATSTSSPKAGLNRTQELGKTAMRARDTSRVDKKKLIISIVAGVCAIVFSNVALVLLVQYMKPSQSDGASQLAMLKNLPRFGPDQLGITAAGERVVVPADDAVAPDATTAPTSLQGAPSIAPAGDELGSQSTNPVSAAPGGTSDGGDEEKIAAGAGVKPAVKPAVKPSVKPAAGDPKGGSPTAKAITALTQGGTKGSTTAASNIVAAADPASAGTTGDGADAATSEPKVKKPKVLNTKDPYVSQDFVGVTAAGLRYQLKDDVFPREEEPPAPAKPRSEPSKAAPHATAKPSKGAASKPTVPMKKSSIQPTNTAQIRKVASAVKTNPTKGDFGAQTVATLNNSKLFGQKLPGNVYGDWKYLDRQRTNKTVGNPQ